MSWITTKNGYSGCVDVNCTVCVPDHYYLYDYQICSKRKRNIPEDLMTLKEVQEHTRTYLHQYELTKQKNKHLHRLEQLNELLEPSNFDKYQPEINKLNNELEIMNEQIILTEEEVNNHRKVEEAKRAAARKEMQLIRRRMDERKTRRKRREERRKKRRGLLLPFGFHNVLTRVGNWI